jgi:hypothetical protein
MSSTSKKNLALLALSASCLALSACEGMDDPAATPTPAVEESFDVITVVPGPDGKVQSTKTRMTDSQWQEIVKRRQAAEAALAADPDPSVFRVRQANNIAGTWTTFCDDPTTSWIYAGFNQTGTRTCLVGPNSDDPYFDYTYDVGYAIHSYWDGQAVSTNICTGVADCNFYQPPCNYGSSVWVRDGAWARGNVSATPPYYTARYVHVQQRVIFPGCRH